MKSIAAIVIFCLGATTFGAHIRHQRHHQKRVYTEIVTSLEQLKQDAQSGIDDMAGSDPLARVLLLPIDLFLNGLTIFLEGGKLFSEPADQITNATVQGTVNALKFFAGFLDTILESLRLENSNYLGSSVKQLEKMLGQLQKRLNEVIERLGKILENQNTTTTISSNPPENSGNTNPTTPPGLPTSPGPIVSNDITSAPSPEAPPAPPAAEDETNASNPPSNQTTPNKRRKVVHKHHSHAKKHV